MSGWRHFGMEFENESEILAKLLHEEFGVYDEMKVEDGFLCLCIYGYGSPPENPDPALVKMLQESDRRGYFVLMNDTTDTGDGLIRFEEGGELVDVVDLVDTEIETDNLETADERTVFDGENSKLPEHQLEAPSFWTVYDLLHSAGFPITDFEDSKY